MLALKENHPLKALNTFGVAVKARYFVEFSNKHQLGEVVELVKKHRPNWLVIGGGSNLLFTEDFSGLIVHNTLKGVEVIAQDEKEILVEVAAGENWHQFTEYALKNGWYGAEYLSLIPGTVGAAPVQNIGAYGVEIKELIEQISAYDFNENRVVTLSNADAKFSYRNSLFKSEVGRFLILSLRLRLRLKPSVEIRYRALEEWFEQHPQLEKTPETVAKAVIAVRESKLPDPKKIGNAGSFFQNPIISIEHFKGLKKQFPELVNYPVDQHRVKLAAGQLIDLCGFKGHYQNGVGMYEKQALVLVNLGGASGKELLNHSLHVKEEVYKKFQIDLQPEPIIL